MRFMRLRLVPRTRSSHGRAARVFANFEFKSGTRNHNVASVPLIPKFASRLPRARANFGIGRLGSHLRPVLAPGGIRRERSLRGNIMDAPSTHYEERQAEAETKPTPTQEQRQVVLVFQGGGALGAYQAGVYQALHESRIEPDWVIGTSIGAINASLIAGNEPGNRVERLEEFWRRMRRKKFWGLSNWPGLADTMSYWSTLLGGIPGFFEPNPLAFLGTHYPLGRDNAGFYSTAPLEKTLTELVDFALVKRCMPRLTVGAAHVRSSQMRYFDSRETAISARHVMASGALPPAFPAVRIDGELYWDGGILSNTPTEAIFDDNPRRNSLIFAVHMWNPMGVEPETNWEVLHRHKDIQYSSRVASHIARQRQVHRLRHVISELVKFIPEADR